MSILRHCTFFWLAVVSLLCLCHGYPKGIDNHGIATLQEEPWDALNSSTLDRRQARRPTWLRVLPLGASIVRGVGSDPKDGFRKPLRDRLRFWGHQVNMIGNEENSNDDPPGSMRNGAHEGVSGDLIDQAYDRMERMISRKPNLVVINVGTNDCSQDVFPRTAHERIGRIVDKILQESPRAVIALSTLLPNGVDPAANDRVTLVNANIRSMVRSRHSEGQAIYLADMNDGSFITVADLPDGIHPNNYGHRKMAAVFDAAITRAFVEERLQEPEDTGFPDDADPNCEKHAGDGRGPVTTQQGSGDHDGAYQHSSNEMGVIHQAYGGADLHNQIHFAQLVNAGGNPDRAGRVDELITYYESSSTSTGEPAIFMQINQGDGNFADAVEIKVNEPGDGCRNRGVRWGDVDNDGLDDFICIGLEGNMYVSRNLGGSPPRFEYLGLYMGAPRTTDQRHVRLADIDGDGRLDYCLTADNGDISCWRNGGIGHMAEYWQDLGVVFTGKGMGNIDGTRFVDINGDFRTDWVWMDDQGKTTIYTNSRGVGQGMAPHWIQATGSHGGMFTDGARDKIKFGMVYAYSGLDYIYITSSGPNPNTGIYTYEFRVWKNTGAGGTKLRGDGNRYCDMKGTGRDDYVWLRSTGEMTLFSNINSPPNWGQDGVIYNFDRDRKSMHLADWTGDGICDVLAVEKGTGRVEMWENMYTGSGAVTFEYRGWVVDQPRCTQGWGVGLFDLGLRFADISGNGRADYLCIEPDGRTTAWLNEPSGMRDVGQVKFAEQSKDRANIRFADVNGDGKADYLWADKFNGDTFVWENEGEVEDRVSGSKFRWTAKDKQYAGNSRGANQYYTDLSGNGRADEHVIDPVTNTAVTWFNDCVGRGAGQDDDEMDSNLPDYDAGENPEDPDQPPGVPGDWDPFFPNKPVWIALGDSYSAGVGAGRAYENPRDPRRSCMTTTGSYPYNLRERNGALRNRLDFLSCTGDVISNVNEQGSHNRDAQTIMLRGINTDDYEFATLSIGGNDLGFSTVVKNCVILGKDTSSSCEDSLASAEHLSGIRDPGNQDQNGLSSKLLTVYDDILSIASPKFTLVVTGYAGFFSEANDECNQGSLGLISAAQPDAIVPKLTRELRSRINTGVRAFNQMIQEAVEETQRRLDRDGQLKRIRFIDIDPLFENHRFCEPEGPDAVNLPASWFFTVAADDILPGGIPAAPHDDDFPEPLQHTRRDLGFCEDPHNEWDCDFGQWIEEHPDGPFNEAIYPRRLFDGPGEWLKTKFMKAFHPRSIGYDAIAAKIVSEWERWATEASSVSQSLATGNVTELATGNVTGGARI